jgi:hypothetical protein
MKLRAIPFLLIAAAVACSTLKTSADFDPSTDFSRYKTWAWHEDDAMKNSIWSKRIQSALESELSKKGLTRNEGNPDLWVAVHVRLSKETQVTTTGGYGYGYRWRGGVSTARVEQIPVGSLIVDLADANQKELVWRGMASDTLNPEKSPEEKEKALREALAKMFENYPPRSK